MPIVTTMTILALLRGNDGAACPFFDPGLLREQVQSGLHTDEAEREPALAIADQLADLLKEYALSVDASLDTYVESSSYQVATAAELIDRLQPMDREREETMRGIIEIRQQLIDLLREEQWSRVFAE